MKTIPDHIDSDKKELENNGINPQRRRHLQNEISELDLNEMTPLDALSKLDELKKKHGL